MKDSSRDSRRIPKEQLTAYERWELPLLDASGNEVAREEEREVKPLTASDIDEIRQAAREDGFREGRDAGYQEGFAEGQEKGHQEGLEAGLAEGREKGEQQGREESRQDVDAKLERLEQVMGELLQPISRHEDELEAALVNLTTELARAVVYRDLATDSSQIQAVVRRAIEALPSTTDNVRIHVHPDDAALITDVATRLDAPSSIVEDPAIMPGGCKVETRNSLVDFTVEKRFQKAVRGMFDKQSELDSAVGAESEGGEAGDGDDINAG